MDNLELMYYYLTFILFVKIQSDHYLQEIH